MSKVYCYPKFRNSGLGNKLFPWARAILLAKKNNYKLIAPNWENYIKIGSYIRKERDKRHYFNIFNNNGYIKSIVKLFILTTVRKISEKEYLNTPTIINKSNAIIVFNDFVGNGIPNYFKSIELDSELIKEELIKIINTSLVPKFTEKKYIGIHVRLTDFKIVENTQQIKKSDALLVRLPLKWYISALQQLRIQLGYCIPARVFSDGNENELEELLNQSNIELVRGNKSITDLLLLSQSTAVIASGSTFSMWAIYLGQVPSIWFPELTRGNLIANDKDYKFQCIWEQGEFPIEFIKKIKENL